MSCADELAHRLGNRVEAVGHDAKGAFFSIARRVGHGDVDAVLVHVQTDVQGARFVRGPSPR